MDIFVKSKPWDRKKPTGDMNGDDYMAWDKWRQQKSADDGDHYLNRRKIRAPSPTRKRIWPKE